MSVRTMARVWEFSRHGGTDLLMLLAIADFSDDDGLAFPSVEKLAKKCRMSKRNAQDRLKALSESGELTILKNQGPPPKYPNLFLVNLELLGVKHASPVQPTAPVQYSVERGAAHCMAGVKPTAPKPSVNHQEPERGAAHSPKGLRLPLDWSLPDEFRKWATENLGWSDSQVDGIADRFADYWHAATGKNATKADWFATWRNWCRREHPKGGKPAAQQDSIFAGAL